MAISFVRSVVLVSTFVLIFSGSAHSQNAAGEMSLQEKAVHHYNQLVSTLTQIQEAGIRNLQPASENGRNSSHDLSLSILRCLLASHPTVQNIGDGSVTNINIFNNSTVNLSSRDKKKKSDKSSTKDKGADVPPDKNDQHPNSEFDLMVDQSKQLSPWMRNLVRPLNFTVKREEKIITVNFDVLRSEPAVVSHTWTFEGERKYLKGPTDYDLDAGQPITSPIGFVLNVSDCPPKFDSRPKKEHFSFSKKSSNLDTVTFTMPTCILDVLNGMEENENKEMEWNKPEDQYTQALYYPDYWNKMNTSTLHTERGKNVTFDMEVAMGEDDHIIIEGYFYNATNDSMVLSDSIFLQLSNREIDEQAFDSPNKLKLFDVEVLNQNQINASIPGIDNKATTDPLYHVSATLRVILMTANEDVSGIVNIQHEMKLPILSKIQQRTSIMSLSVMKAVQILRPDEIEAVPKGKYITHTKKKFRCGVHGFAYYNGYGDNCVFFCSIVGTNLKSIRVRKVSGGITPVQKYAEVNSHNAVLLVNLGPTRKEIDGEYECRAIEIGGKRHKWKVSVGTWGFPLVLANETSLEVQNDSSTFVCVVRSERPVNLSIALYHGRLARIIDGEPNVTRSLHKHGDQTRMELTFPTSYLRWPYEFLSCVAENEAGVDESTEWISSNSIPDYYYQTDHAFLLRDESSTTDHGDGTATVKCVATGASPLEITFYFDPYSKEDIIRSNSMNSIKMRRDGAKTIAILEIPSASLRWPRHTISCRAKNKYGEDSIDFELSNLIHDFYN